MNTSISTTRRHLEALFERLDPPRARLIFAIDATASRQPTWDLAAALTHQMFGAVADGRLEIQLVYYNSDCQCVASRWVSDPRTLSTIMSSVSCAAGLTQIRRVLNHIEKEDQHRKVNACVLIGDACEELSGELYVAARRLNRVPMFMFHEGADEEVATIFRTIANLTGGAYSRFDGGAPKRLAELLKAAVAFAVGGRKALAADESEGARLLLAQMRK